MMLYFQTPINKNGYRLQATINTETGEAEKGYFLFRYNPVDAIEIPKKQLEKLFEQVFAEYENKRKGGLK